MHLMMILAVLVSAWFIRWLAPKARGIWFTHWQRSTSQISPWAIALFFFLFPPLLLIMTAIAVVSMGYRGEMLGWQASWFSYLLALMFLALALISWISSFFLALRSCQKITQLSQEKLAGRVIRIINIDFPYSATVGLWKTELVISQGMLDLLESEHLMAVIAHEQAHQDYHDTFWFFWLGWLRSLTNWLPNTESLWQELLLLREIRADEKAALDVDPLVLAESLLLVAQTLHNSQVINMKSNIAAAFYETNHLEQRIDALITDNPRSLSSSKLVWLGLLLVFLPLITIPLHN